ncbi:surface polysaccharide O-acyltransferase-like enzyme [Anoxybacillus voinovskiensis]|uniref:Surface polysaccharide O-acyltransferase-like enzyme n=1 Tax=Anoxybacteroides voinovskiense TaxID=230470 RepID=A0A840DL12_9BACL|nr:acyltransferase [Anoxybacillus voinovskiensis]MBB4072395.1 surface polysaccharide O-acyltransferase-like enzyme [Anoxybacillus voinovskiensis]GGJ58223.1 membrane protein [Anoxybacillus voinovskiensis]
MNHRQPSELVVMKSLAFLAVVFQSALLYVMNHRTLRPEEAVMVGMLFNFVKFSAPVFVFLAGFHMAQQSIAHYRSYVMHKGKELLLPYVFWAVVYLLLLTKDAGWSEWVKQFLTGDAAPHLWYVVMIFQFHLLAPLFVRFFTWLKTKGAWTKALIGGAMVYLLFLRSFAQVSASPLHYLDRSFFAYFFYFLLGGVAAQTLPKWRKFVLQSIPFNTFLFLALFIFVGYELLTFKNIFSIDLKAATYLKPSMFFYVCSEILLLYALSMTIVQTKSPLYTVLRFINRYTYGAYLGHLFFLYVFAHTLNIAAPLLQGVVLFAITAFFSVGCCALLHLSPVSALVIGHEQKQWEWRLSPLMILKK